MNGESMQEIIIVGAGGFGREVCNWLWDCFSQEHYRLKGFLSQDDHALDQHDIDAQVLGDPADYQPEPKDRFILAIGDIDARRRTVESLCGRGAFFLTMIHPTAVVASTASIAQGAVLYPFVTISNCAVLDDFVHLSLYASVGHDGKAGKFSLLSPYATLNGFSAIEDEVFLGTHATIGPSCVVGRQSKISANSAVLHNVRPGSFIHGVPGKQTRRFDLT